MNQQEVFDKVVVHALTMTRPSHGPDYCMYRGPRGNKCFVGALISDEFYRPHLEGCDANNRVVLRALEQSGIAGVSEHSEMLVRLQQIHDNASYDPKNNRPFKRELREGLTEFAKNNGLKFEVAK